MKKYLMTGVAALAICAAFTSCSKSEELFNQGAIDQQKGEKVAQSYNEAFVQVFGNPAADQDWGFNSDAARRSNTRAATRGENANANLWYKTYNVPANVTTDERKWVTDYFTDNTFENQYRINNVDFTDFFIFQVYKGEAEYRDNSNPNYFVGSNQMNHLQTYVGGTMEEFDAVPGYSSWLDNVQEVKGNLRREHMNDFNAGNNTENVQWDGYSDDEHRTIGAMLMVNSGTADFSYHNSTDSKYHNTYIIIPGEQINASLKGFWYVGFDFYADGQNGNQQVTRDWKFNDWIVRISPARKIGEDPNYTIRVIGEDLTLGQDNDLSLDFDFNDVVFDVALNVPGKTYIKVKAAGGTLPLIIGVANPDNAQSYDDNEVHHILGYSDTSIMINTNAASKGLRGGSAEDGILVLNTAYSNASQIPVFVKKNGVWCELTAKQGEPASKIGISNMNFRWCDERTSMKGTYPLFTQWVKATSEFRGSIVWW